MPWPRDQAVAIAISYRKRGKKPPPEVSRALEASIPGGKSGDEGPRGTLARRMVHKRKRKKHHR